MTETPEQLKARFTWESDGRIDSYHILAKSGPVSGDCDDFASTMSYSESGSKVKMFFNIVTGRHRFYWCRSPSNEAHVILWVKGKGYTDNIFPSYRPEPTGHTKVRYLFWLPFLKLLIGKVTN